MDDAHMMRWMRCACSRVGREGTASGMRERRGSSRRALRVSDGESIHAALL